MYIPIQTYAINLAKRTQRREHIINQFKGKTEFSLILFPAIEHEKGAFGLWKSIQQIVRNEADKESDYFLLCEDDHIFTEDYTPELLQQCIIQAQSLNADLLSGGVSWFDNAMQITEHLFWLHIFNGMQFTIVFKKFYQPILDAQFDEMVVADISLSGITDNKFVIYPYISTQKEFGYSDVTSKNGKKGYVEDIFNKSIKRLEILNKVKKHYEKQRLYQQ